MRVAFDLPNEDEFAVCLLSRCSPYMSLVFPRRAAHYQRFMTLAQVSPAELSRWREALAEFVKKFSGATGRRPVLKSPPHTCRIRLLLELFPGAKFLHVHRHPHDVFRSRLAQLAAKKVRHNLQVWNDAEVEEQIVAVYREMHDSFFRERELIPGGCYHEIAFERLTSEPMAELRTAYRALELGDFNDPEADVAPYLKSVVGYSRNNYEELSITRRRWLSREWAQSFDEWHYSA